MQIPKDIPVWEHAPTKKLAEVTVRLKNVRGALAQASRVIADTGVIVLSGFTSAASESTFGVWSFFADVTEATVDLAEVKRLLLKLPVVGSVEVLRAEDGFMVDRQHFPVRFSNRRALIMRTDALDSMFTHLWSVFGSGAVTIVDQMAEAIGRFTAKEILEDIGGNFARQYLDDILRTYTALGYADVEVRRKDEDSMTISAKGLFECEANAKHGVKRRSAFLRGHLRGLLSTLFESEVEVTEVECVADGDEACSFNVAKTARLAARIPLQGGIRSA